tara:strand:+ start:201 stop:575 length:375 start_codon:yes stop_codon:yes gene_type:complete
MKITAKQLRELIVEEAASLAGKPKESVSDWGVKSGKVDNLAKKGKYGSGWEQGKGAEGLLGAKVAIKSLKEQRKLGISDDNEIGRIENTRLLESGIVTHLDVVFGNTLIKGIPVSRVVLLQGNE